ncbi:MAG: ABC transporter permease, partial [Candidatus Eiseniibacteriota bacterium]
MTRTVARQVGDIVLASLVLIVVWQVLTLLVGARNLPGPLATAARLASAFGQPSFIEDLAATARAYVWALAIAMGGGVALGLLFGGWRALGDTFEPAMHVLVSVPKVALYPIILLLFGLGDPAKIAFGVLHGPPTVVII